MKKYILILAVILFNACNIDGGIDTSYMGLSMDIYNETGELHNGKIFIGGLKNGEFEATDSITLSNIKFENSKRNVFFIRENRWKPDLNKVRSISSKCYFKIKLSNSREEMVYNYDLNEFFSLNLPNENYYVDDYGFLIISLENDNILGKVARLTE